MSIIYVVPQSHCVIIERFGKFHAIQKEGLHLKVPILDAIRTLESWGDVANKRGYLIELTEQQTDTPPRTCHTKDNVPVMANASVYWKIHDPHKALYEVDVLPRAVADIALNALRSNIGARDLDQVLTERQELNDVIEAQLADSAAGWGIAFTRVEIQELSTDKDVSAAMLQQMDAERKRRALVTEAEGRAAAETRVAEAEKQAMILRAEGQAEALRVMAEAERQYLSSLGEGLSTDSASRLLLAQKYINGFETISRNPADKVFVPNSFQGLFSFAAEDGVSAKGRSESDRDV